MITTPYRPVPLEHHLWAEGDMHVIMDAKGEFKDTGYNKAVAAFKKPSAAAGNRGGRGGGPTRGGSSFSNGRSNGNRQQLKSLVDYLTKSENTPAVVFSFSKKKCEECAAGLSKVNLVSNGEKSAIHVFLETSLSRLQGSDRTLPQILGNKELLLRGIGVHHGGLLPIMKEIVEILFGRGLIKVLFATETFAMGVNMPGLMPKLV